MKKQIHPVKSCEAGILNAKLFNMVAKTVFLWTFLFGIFGLAKNSQAKDLYVSTTGNDSVTYANNDINHPWATVQNATTQALAGDTINLRSGTYVEHDITFGHSGTSGNIITLQNYPGESATIDSGYTTYSATRHPVIVIDNRNYITIQGITIRRGMHDNIYIAENFPTSNITIQNCDINNFVVASNGAGIYINTGGADNIVIMNNKIHDRIAGGSPWDDTTANGIILFHARKVDILNNEIYGDLFNGIYYKHSTDNGYITTVENNWIHDLTAPSPIHNFTHNAIDWSSSNGIIRNNLITNLSLNSYAMLFFAESATCNVLPTRRNQISHNTIINSIKGINLDRSASCEGAIDTVVKDNLIYNFTNNEMRGFIVYPYYSGSDVSNTTLTNNLIYSASYPSPIRVLSSYYNTSTCPLSTCNNNISLAPTFVDYAGGNFALAPGSNGKNAASDGKDMGADVSLVGPNAGAPTDTTAPSSPNGLSIS